MEVKRSKKSVVYLSLGSNLGDRLENLQSAIRLIGQKTGEIISVSPVYETPPLGFESNDYFYNSCIAIQTDLTPDVLLGKLNEIEQLLGRTKKTAVENRANVYSSRTIDIDILFYDDLILKTAKLTIPHTLFASRKFVLFPLNDIASDYVDPLSQRKVSELLSICKDLSDLYRTEFDISL